MPAVDALFLLPGAARRDPAVEAWFDSADPLRLMLRPWFEAMRDCGADVREIMHDHCPTACLDTPLGPAAFAYVAAYSRHGAIGFFHGVWMDDPAGLLEGGGKRMRHVKLRLGEERDEGALAALVAQGYRAAALAAAAQG